MADVKYPGIPAIPSRIAPELRALLGPIRESIQRLTAGELPTNGVLDALNRLRPGDIGAAPGVFPGTELIDSTPPPAPTGLTAAGAIANIVLAWDPPAPEAKARVAYTEIHRAETNDISLAKLIGQTAANVFTDSIGSAATRFYWIRYVSPANVKPLITGSFNSQTGTQGATGYDASYLIDVLTANPPAGANFSPTFYVQPTAITIDGVSIPAGVYMNQAIIRNLSVSNAKIANLAVDNAKIASLDAAKINTGFLLADRIEANSLNANKLTAKTVTALQIFSKTITTDEIKVGAVSRNAISSSQVANITTTGIASHNATPIFEVTLGSSLLIIVTGRVILNDGGTMISIVHHNGVETQVHSQTYTANGDTFYECAMSHAFILKDVAAGTHTFSQKIQFQAMASIPAGTAGLWSTTTVYELKV